MGWKSWVGLCVLLGRPSAGGACPRTALDFCFHCAALLRSVVAHWCPTPWDDRGERLARTVVEDWRSPRHGACKDGRSGGVRDSA
ncbi:hypothetical protein GE21DRAFT_1290501 [Neurospora crassa]|nr:hypothetical protein GE21DRAFT_1290501 [Neurospora crassa]